MAKYSETEKKQKVEHARQLYCKGFDYDIIADIMGDISATTLRNWSVEFDFDKSKRSQIIALSEIRNSILESFAELLDGKKPKIKPDEAAKYATAFEKFSDKKKVLMFMYEAYELLQEEFMRELQNTKERKAQEQILAHYKYMREKMNTVVNQLTKEALNE